MKKRRGLSLALSFLLTFFMIVSEVGTVPMRVFAQEPEEAQEAETPEEADEPAVEEPEAPTQQLPEEEATEEDAGEPDGDPVEHYGVWIGGEEITSENCDNLPNLEGGTGNLEIIKKNGSYWGYFLTLNGVTGIKGGYDIKSKGEKALIYGTNMIQLLGDSTLTNDNGPIIWVENDINCTVSIRGKHSFKCKSENAAVKAKNGTVEIYSEETELTVINDAGTCLSADRNLYFKNGKVNVSGRAGVHATQKIEFSGDHGDYTIKSAGIGLHPVLSYGSDESDIVLNGTEILKPENGQIVSTGSGMNKMVTIRDQEGESVSEVHVVTTTEKYDLWVGDTQITSYNKDNIPNLEGTDATGTYDPTQHILELHNVTGITGSYKNALIYGTNWLRIEGDSKLDAGNGHVILMEFDPGNMYGHYLIIAGQHTFTNNSANAAIRSVKGDVAIFGVGTDITIKNSNSFGISADMTFELQSGKADITGGAGVYADRIEFKSGEAKITATSMEALRAVSKIVLDEKLEIIEPDQAQIKQKTGSDTSWTIMDKNDKVAKTVVVGPKPEKYDLWIGDTQITSANKDDIPNLKGGKGTYNPNTHTLTLNGVTEITGSHNNALISTDTAEPLNIEGSANLTNQEGSVIYTNGNLTLKGDFYFYSGKSNTIDANTNSITVDGKLTAWSVESGRYGLYTYGGSANVSFKSGKTYLNGKGGVFATTVRFEGGELSADVTENAFHIGNDGDIKFADGYGIIEPSGAFLGADPDSVYSKTVLNADGSRANKVRFGLLSDSGLFVGFDDTDPTITKDADGKYTAVYTGVAVKPEVLLKNNGKVLIEGVDYKVRYSKNVNVGTATVTISGKGKYNKKRVLNFEIVPKNLSDPYNVIIGNTSYQKGKKPAPTVAYYGRILKANKDYEIEVNDTKLTVKGKGNFKGSHTVNILEQEADVYKKSAFKVKFSYENMAYSGFAQRPSWVDLDVRDLEGNSLFSYYDFDVSFSENVNAGTVKFVVLGKGAWNGVYKGSYKILPDKYSTFEVSGLKDSYPYSKYGVKPVIEVKCGSRILKEGRDYSLSYKNNKKLGTGSIVLKFLGNYKGATYDGEKNFKIETAVPSLSSSIQVIAGDMIFKKPGKYQPAVWTIIYGRLLAKSELKVELMEKDKLNEAKNGLVLTAMGTGNYNFSKPVTYNVVAEGKDVNKAKVTLVQGGKTVKKVPYTGKEITFSSGDAAAPQLSVKLKDGTVLTGAEVEANFDIYYADNVEKGKATVILKAKNGSGFVGACAGVFTITAMSLEEKK